MATWGSVQASTSSSEIAGAESGMMQSKALLAASYYGTGQIKSASYDASNNNVYMTYTLSNASSASVKLLSTRTGNIVGTYSLGLNSNSKTFVVDPKIDEGLYVLILYVDGNTRSSMNVNITAQGTIKSISSNLSNTSLTVGYTMKHGSAYGNSLRIFDGTKLVKKVSLSNANTSTSITFDSSSLTPGKKYTFQLYSNENPLKPTKTYTMPYLTGSMSSVTYSPGETYPIAVEYTLKYARKPTVDIYDASGKKVKSVSIANSSSTNRITIDGSQIEANKTYEVYICDNGVKTSIHRTLSTQIVAPPPTKIVEARFEGGNRIWIKFNLKKTGVNVGFKLVSTRTGKTYDYNYGDCTVSESSYYMYMPSTDCSAGLYVILLTENGSVVDSKQIMISK